MRPDPITQAFLEPPRAFNIAGKLVLTYLAVTACWTIGLDFGLTALIDDPTRLSFWQGIKDLLFLMGTALVLLYALRNLLRRQRLENQAFWALQRGTAGVIGQDYCQFLAESLPELLNTKVCFIGEWDQTAGCLKLLAGSPAEFVRRFAEYPLGDTPCAAILHEGRAMSLTGKELKGHFLVDNVPFEETAHFFGVPLLNPAGQTIGLLATFTDEAIQDPGLTLDTLQAFAARASSELSRLLSESRNFEYFNQLATVFDSLNASIYVADMETYELLYVNKYTEEMFGKDWRQKPCYNYLQNGLDEVCGFCTNSSLLIDGEPGPPIVWEYRNSRNNRWYQCLDKCLRWTDGRLARLEIALDITPGKEMEQTKEEMLSVVSHEMRTPLTAITGFTELLLDEENLPSNVRQHLQTIFTEAEKMTELVNTFLELRRLKANRARIDYEPLTVRELVNQGVRKTADCSEIHDLRIHCPPELKVFGNRQELVQVVAKLLSNACRFSPDGGTVALHVRQENGQALFCFQDSGIGIPAEEQEKIFDHFHRLDRGDRRQSRGVGLGLSLVRETIELHGGRVWVESEPGQGSRFYLKMPSYQEQSSPQE